MLVPKRDIGIGIKGIDIVHRRKLRRTHVLNKKNAAPRFCRLDNAFDDLLPAGRVEIGVVNRGDEIGLVRHGPLPARWHLAIAVF